MKLCKKCLKKYDNYADTCMYCGTKLETDNSDSSSASTEKIWDSYQNSWQIMSEPDIDASAVRPEYVGHERVVVRQPHRLCIPILPTKHKGNTIFLVVESFSKISEMPIHRPILSMMSLKIYPPQQSNNRLYLVVEPIPPSQAGELF